MLLAKTNTWYQRYERCDFKTTGMASKSARRDATDMEVTPAEETVTQGALASNFPYDGQLVWFLLVNKK